jgi:hypothetical protein
MNALNVSALSMMVMVINGESTDGLMGLCGVERLEGIDEYDDAAALLPRCSEMPAKPFGRWVFGFMQKADNSSLQAIFCHIS